jgi:predicted dehydrogenase
VIRVSEETGKFFTVHQQRRYDPDYRVVRDVIRSGEIGRVTTIESRVMGERGVCFGWRADPESGGGMLYDWGVHLIDQILTLYPEEQVTSVYARILSVLTPAVDDLFEVTMTLSNGVAARVNVGTFALQKLPRWFVFGDRGTLKLDDFTGTAGGAARIRGDVQGFDSVLGKTSLGPSRTMAPLKPEYLERLELPKEEDMTMAFWTQLHEALVNGEKPAVETEQVLRQMKIVEAAFESSRKNEVVHTEI